MTSRYDLLTSTPYKDQSGQTKRRYTKIGAMWPSKQGEGFSIKLEALPLPNAEGEVWISAFVPRENDQQGGGRPITARQVNAPLDIDDGIPFEMSWK